MLSGHKVFRNAVSFARGRRGAIALIFALTAPVVFGAAAMVIDISLWFAQHAAAQTAADSAALTAVRDTQNTTYTNGQLNTDGTSAANLATNNAYHFGGSSGATLTVTTSTVAANTTLVSAIAAIPHFVGFGSAFGTLVQKPDAANGAVRGVASAQISSAPSRLSTCYLGYDYTALFSPAFATINSMSASGIDPIGCGAATPQFPEPSGFYFGSGGPLGPLVGSVISNGLINLSPFYMTICLDTTCSPLQSLVSGASNAATFLQLLGLNDPCLSGANPLYPQLYTGKTTQTVMDTLGTHTVNCDTSAGTCTTAPTQALFASSNAITCTSSTCTVNAGTYCGGIVFPPNATIVFQPGGLFGSGGNNGSGLSYLFGTLEQSLGALLGDDQYIMESGNMVLQTSDIVQGYNSSGAPISVTSTDTTSLGTSGNGSNATFFFLGSSPGAMVLEDQEEISPPGVNQGTMSFTSNFGLNSKGYYGDVAVYTQPVETAAETAQDNDDGLLKTVTNDIFGLFGLQGISNFLLPQKLFGMSYQFTNGLCPGNYTTCTTAQSPTNATNTINPPLPVLTAAANLLSGVGTGVCGLLQFVFGIPCSSTSYAFVYTVTTDTNSVLNFTNGVPGTWGQTQKAQASSTYDTVTETTTCIQWSLVCLRESAPTITSDTASLIPPGTLYFGSSGVNPYNATQLTVAGTYINGTTSTPGTPITTASGTSASVPNTTSCTGNNSLLPSSPTYQQGNIYGIEFTDLLGLSSGELGGPAPPTPSNNPSVDPLFTPPYNLSSTLSVCGSGSDVQIITPQTQLTSTTSAGTGTPILSQ